MSQIRPKNLPRVPAPVAGDTVTLDGATARSILWSDLIANGGPLVNARRWLKGDGSDEQVGITAAIAYCVANSLTLEIPDGVYRHSGTINWAFNNLHVRSPGDDVVFIHTGAGIAHNFNGMLNYPGSQGCDGGVFGGPGTITLRGNPNGATTRTFNLDNWHNGYAKMAPLDGQVCLYGDDTGIVGASAVGTVFDGLDISGHTVAPQRGIYFTRPYACSFKELRIEGCGAGNHWAGQFNEAVGCKFYTPIIESNTAGGLFFDPSCSADIFFGISAEANGTAQDLYFTGSNSHFFRGGCTGTTLGSFISGSNNVVEGTRFQSLLIDAAASNTRLVNPIFVTSFTDNSPNTTILGATGGLGVVDKVPFVGVVSNIRSINADTEILVQNTSGGGSARAGFHAASNAANATFGIGGAGYTDRPLLANRAFIEIGALGNGIVLSALGTNPVIFASNNVEGARLTAANEWNISGFSTAQLAVGRLGATNPALRVNTANDPASATGLIVSAQAAGGGVNVAAISPNANENLLIDAKGAGQITFGAASTGPMVFNRGVGVFANVQVTAASALAFAAGLNGTTNPAFQVDTSVAGQAGGLKVAGSVSGGTVAVTAIDSGANVNLSISAKGTGTMAIGSGSTGVVTITPALSLGSTLNGNTFTPGSYTVTGSAGKTLNFANSLNLSGNDGAAVAFGAGGTPIYSGGNAGTPSAIVLTNASGTAPSLTAGAATNAVNTGVTDDTTTNATMFLTWVTANSGNLPQKVTSTKLTYNPSTGNLFSSINTVANGIGNGLFFNASGGTPDSQIYQGAANTLGIKLGTANLLNITKNDSSSIIDYAVSTASTLTITPALTAAVSVNTPIRRGATGSKAVVNGLNSDIATPANSSVRLTGPTAVFSVGGFTGGLDGYILEIYCTVAFAMTIVNEDASSTAGNRIKTLTGANVTLRAGTSMARLKYDATDARWILVATN